MAVEQVRCQSCGAALPVVPGVLSLKCVHCGSIHTESDPALAAPPRPVPPPASASSSANPLEGLRALMKPPPKRGLLIGGWVSLLTGVVLLGGAVAGSMPETRTVNGVEVETWQALEPGQRAFYGVFGAGLAGLGAWCFVRRKRELAAGAPADQPR